MELVPKGENKPLMDGQKIEPPLAGGEDLDDRNEDVDTQIQSFYDNEIDSKDVDDVPIIISSRIGEGGDDGTDPKQPPSTVPNGGNVPTASIAPTNRPDSHYPERFPVYDHRGFSDFEHAATDMESIPDVNVYQHKKTLAQGMMDLALFSANANQLRYVVESYDRHPYFYPSVIMISLSLICQVAIGIGLIWNAHYNVKDKKEICIANRINNYTVIGIFLVTTINVFVSAFGVASAPAVVPLSPRIGEDDAITMAP